MTADHAPPSCPDVDVVVVNFNAGQHLAQSVASILASPRVGLVIISDNGSTDSSLSLLGQQVGNDDRVRIVKNDSNLGFSAACNRGAQHASAPFVLILNPDCIVGVSTLERMLEVMRKLPDVGMTGCVIRDPDGSEQVASRRAIPDPWIGVARMLLIDKLWPKAPSRFRLNHNKDPLPPSPLEVEAISGALMLVRRTAIAQVGMLDEGYFLHCEDLDWFVRFREEGWKIYLIPDVDAVHHKGACSKTSPIWVLWHKHRGMTRFFRKFQHHRFPLIFSWLVVIGIWFRFAMVAFGVWIQRQLDRITGRR